MSAFGAPDDVPTTDQVRFALVDCDDPAAAVRRLGGHVVTEPAMSAPGRAAVATGDRGARFSLIDLDRRAGPIPGR
jgi:hypothetical protein